LKKDPKTALQELLQGRGLPLPVYALVGENAGDLSKRYTASCEIASLKIRTTGYGPTRKQAESAAANTAISVCSR
jgi:ribonuclease III